MFNLLQNSENREKPGCGVREKKFELQSSFIRCPGCMSVWGSLLELQRSGGVIRSLGLRLQATCPECGNSWGVNKYWRCSKVVDGN